MSGAGGTGFEDDGTREEVETALLKKALRNLRSIVKGNGLKTKDVTFEDFKGEVLNFEAHEVFTIETVVSEKHVPGREQGELAGSYPDAQQRIKAAVEKIKLDKEVRRLTIDLLKKRNDLGFAADGLIINLERLNKKIVTHEPCPPCASTGRIPCTNCKGKRQILCTKCTGQREIICHVCRGTQFTNTGNGRQQCLHCHGRGRIRCPLCQQAGYISCPKCKATGKMPCQNCSTTGWNSHVFHVAVRAKGKFLYDRNALPPDVPDLIDDYGSEIVTDEHAQVRIIEETRRAEELDRISKHNEYIIPYHVRLPWGDIVFTLKGEERRAKLFGCRPQLEMLPPVLEKTMARGLDALTRAARASGNVAQLVGNSIRYRAIGETFLAVLRNTPARALWLMQKRYPYGIEEETLDGMVRKANMALKHLTVKPRLQGLGAGAVLAAALLAVYFIGGLRGDITTQAPELIVDVAAFVLGGAAISVLVHFSAVRALQNALGSLLRKNPANRKKLTPPLWQSMLWGYPAAAILFAAMMQLSIMQGAPPPGWLRPPVPEPPAQDEIVRHPMPMQQQPLQPMRQEQQP